MASPTSHLSPFWSELSDLSQILLKNGSAVEAAITTSLCAGLYHPHSCGIGGGFFMVVYDRTTGKATAIDARETAPAAATELMFVEPEDKDISPVQGWHAIGVPGGWLHSFLHYLTDWPHNRLIDWLIGWLIDWFWIFSGEIAGYWEAFQRFGSGNLKWEDLFEPVIKLARDGLRVNAVLAKAIADNADIIRTFDEGLTDIFVKNKTTGKLYVEGDLIKYPKLAETLQTIANDKDGIREFYQGSIAAKLTKDIEHGSESLIISHLSIRDPMVILLWFFSSSGWFQLKISKIQIGLKNFEQFPFFESYLY
jgi:gamma-glutamyltranspeptidase